MKDEALEYEIVVKKVSVADGGDWFAYYKDFKGVMGDGEGAQEAIGSAAEAFAAYVGVALEHKSIYPSQTPPIKP